jgi:hypothetical protein
MPCGWHCGVAPGSRLGRPGNGSLLLVVESIETERAGVVWEVRSPSPEKQNSAKGKTRNVLAGHDPKMGTNSRPVVSLPFMRVIPAAIVFLAHVPATLAQPHATPSFEVSSIKVCKPGEIVPGVEVRSGGSGKIAGDNSTSRSPGRLTLNCSPLRSLVKMAYLDFADGRRNIVDPRGRVEGGPAWVDEDRYGIVAKAESRAWPVKP